jgi:GT2 family glycosyltransferase
MAELIRNEVPVATIEAEFASNVKLAWEGGLDFFGLFAYAGQLEAAGRNALAAVLYRTWVERNQTPYNPFVWFNLGVALSNEDDLPAAMEAYGRAIQLAPDFAQPRLNLGLLHERRGEPEAALAQWRFVAQNLSPAAPDQAEWRRQASNHIQRLGGPAEAAAEGDLSYRSPVDASFQPKVSAILSVYKAGRYVQGCLEDLRQQSLFQAGQLEVVVVDSNSPEAEGPIIRAFAERFPRQVQYLRTRERETIYAAWNRGVQAARGSYLTNANADDRHRPEGLELLARSLDEHPDIALAYGDDDVTQEENGTFAAAPRTGRFQWPEFDPVHLFEICFAGPHPLWRKALHQKYGLFDPSFRSAGDYDFWLRLAAAGERFLHVPATVGLYLQCRQGMELGNPQLSALESFLARTRNWPSAWGTLPEVRGNYLLAAE